MMHFPIGIGNITVVVVDDDNDDNYNNTFITHFTLNRKKFKVLQGGKNSCRHKNVVKLKY